MKTKSLYGAKVALVVMAVSVIVILITAFFKTPFQLSNFTSFFIFLSSFFIFLSIYISAKKKQDSSDNSGK